MSLTDYICALLSAEVSRPLCEQIRFSQSGSSLPIERAQGVQHVSVVSCWDWGQCQHGGAVEKERGRGLSPAHRPGAHNGGRGGLGVTAPGPHPSSAATAPQQRLRHLIGWLGQVTAVSQSGVECEAVLISTAPEARAGP